MVVNHVLPAWKEVSSYPLPITHFPTAAGTFDDSIEALPVYVLPAFFGIPNF